MACSAVNAIPGMKGYVGVDLVLSNDSVWLIEINPRVTTSYIGLRQILSANLAEIIWNACTRETLPESVPMAGWVVIEKDHPSTWGYR